MSDGITFHPELYQKTNRENKLVQQLEGVIYHQCRNYQERITRSYRLMLYLLKHHGYGQICLILESEVVPYLPEVEFTPDCHELPPEICPHCCQRLKT